MLGGALLADSLSVFDPASPPAQATREFFFLVLAILAVIFLLVEGLILYCVFRFGGRTEPAGAEPPQVYGSRPIEVAWTLAPVLIVFVLFLVVVRSVAQVRPNEPPPGAVHATVIGYRWWWAFAYPDQGFRTANELHVPASDPDHPRPIYLELQAQDVIHSFWVPRLAGKTDLIPGRTNRMWLQPLEVGTFLGQCAEYCGTQHANMHIRVLAEPPETFRAWLENQQKPAVQDPAARAGRRLFLTKTCGNCHTIRGTPAAGIVGPDLTHLMSRQTLGAGVLPNDRDRLAAWVTDPQAIKPGNLMPNLHLSPEEVASLVRYLETLR